MFFRKNELALETIPQWKWSRLVVVPVLLVLRKQRIIEKTC
jgi:hypothetical protein